MTGIKYTAKNIYHRVTPAHDTCHAVTKFAMVGIKHRKVGNNVFLFYKIHSEFITSFLTFPGITVFSLHNVSNDYRIDA